MNKTKTFARIYIMHIENRSLYNASFRFVRALLVEEVEKEGGWCRWTTHIDQSSAVIDIVVYAVVEYDPFHCTFTQYKSYEYDDDVEDDALHSLHIHDLYTYISNKNVRFLHQLWTRITGHILLIYSEKSNPQTVWLLVILDEQMYKSFCLYHGSRESESWCSLTVCRIRPK